LGAVSYSHSIVTLAVSLTVYEIFSVKEWRDLETGVRGGSRSLKMAPFDRSRTTFCWSAIVNIAASCTIVKLYLTLNNCDLRSLKVIQTGIIRKIGCGFLFAFHSNHGRMRYSASKNGVKTSVGVVLGH